MKLEEIKLLPYETAPLKPDCVRHCRSRIELPFVPIEKTCPSWPAARNAIKDCLPPFLEFRMDRYGFDLQSKWALDIANLTVAADFKDVARRLNDAQRLLNAMSPTKRLMALIQQPKTPATLCKANSILRDYDLELAALGAATLPQAIAHAMGIREAALMLTED